MFIERYEDAWGTWAICHDPSSTGRCIYGEPWIGIHAHLLDADGGVIDIIVRARAA